MKAFLRAQLERYTQRLAELDFLLSREDIMKDMPGFMALSRERTEVGAVAERYQQHQQRQQTQRKHPINISKIHKGIFMMPQVH